MRLRDVNFDTWLRSHPEKDPEERWLRELYPWPVLAQVDCDVKNVGRAQRIAYDDVIYDVTLVSVAAGAYHRRLCLSRLARYYCTPDRAVALGASWPKVRRPEPN